MIERANYLAVREFFRFRLEVSQVDPRTEAVQRNRLKHLLTWAGPVDLSSPKIETLRPTFPAYIAGLKPSGFGARGERFTPESAKKIVDHARFFLEWARVHLPAYKRVSPAWVDTLRPVRMERPVKERQIVTLEIVRQLLRADWPTPRGMRAKAAAAFLFLSGMRATAFATMPLEAVDLERRTVRQLASLGVRTKNKKSAVTALLDIPDLVEACRPWHAYVRQSLAGEAGYWFAPFVRDFGGVDSGEAACRIVSGRKRSSTNNVASVLRKDIAELFTRAGLAYLSPHKFRHGHATYGLKLARDIADLKAVSQNLMHSNIGITDGIYAILSADDMQARIAALGSHSGEASPASEAGHVAPADLSAIVEEVMRRVLAGQTSPKA